MKLTNMQAIKRHRTRLKVALVEAFGGKCLICGLEDEPYLYDFHHLNPAEKEFGISQTGDTRGKDRIAAEAQKCIMVCSNCHRRIEAKKVTIPLTESNFDVQVYYDTIDKMAGRETAAEKLQKEQEKQERKQKKENFPTKEELKSLIRTYPFTRIGEMYDVSDNAVRRWCTKFNLPSRKCDINSYSDSEWELI